MLSGASALKPSPEDVGAGFGERSDCRARALALEAAPLRVNVVTPGTVDTAKWNSGKIRKWAEMSLRNFARVFVRETGATPAKYVEQLRLEAARRQMEESDMSLEGIVAKKRNTIGF